MLWVGLIAQAHAQGLANASKVRSAVAPPDRLGNNTISGVFPTTCPHRPGELSQRPLAGRFSFGPCRSRLRREEPRPVAGAFWTSPPLSGRGRSED